MSIFVETERENKNSFFFFFFVVFSRLVLDSRGDSGFRNLKNCHPQTRFTDVFLV